MINSIKRFWNQGCQDIWEFFIIPILGLSYYKRCFLLVLSGVLVYVPLMNTYNATHDEQFSMVLFGYPWKEMFRIIAVEDGHPPLYYIIYRLFQLGGDFHNILPLRIATLTFFVLTALLGIFPLRRLVGEKASLLFIVCVFFLPSSLWLGINMRMYPLVVYVTSGAFIYSMLIWREDRKANWFCFFVFTLAGLYTHYFSGIILVLVWVNLFVRLLVFRQFQKIFILCGIGVIISFLFLPWLYVFLHQYNNLRVTWFPRAFQRDASIYGAFFSLRVIDNPILECVFLFLGFFCWILILEYLVESKRGVKKQVVKSAFFVFWGVYLVAIILSFVFRPTSHARFLVVNMGIFYVAIALSVEFYKKFQKLFICLLSLFFVIGYVEYYQIANDKGIETFVANFRKKISKESLIVYTDSQSHLFLRFYLPEYKIIYAPIEPTPILLQNEILQERLYNSTLDVYDSFFYARKDYISLKMRKYYAEELEYNHSDFVLDDRYSNIKVIIQKTEKKLVSILLQKSEKTLKQILH